MSDLSSKCPLCSKTYSIPRDECLYYCGDCGFSWIEETKKNLKPAPPVESNENVWKHSKTKLFKRGLDLLEELLPKKGRLLDIGTGFGYFLDLARERGWQVSGIEIEKKAVEFARSNYRLEIFTKPISELGLPDNTFDAVTLWIVLEQLPDPKGELLNILRILKPGGVIYIRAYNYSFHRLILGAARLMNAVFRTDSVIIHSYNFTPKSLRKILGDTGFAGIKIMNSPASAGDPYSTGGVLGAGFVGSVKSLIYWLSQAVAFMTFGRVLLASTLVAYARKPK